MSTNDLQKEIDFWTTVIMARTAVMILKKAETDETQSDSESKKIAIEEHDAFYNRLRETQKRRHEQAETNVNLPEDQSETTRRNSLFHIITQLKSQTNINHDRSSPVVGVLKDLEITTEVYKEILKDRASDNESSAD